MAADRVTGADTDAETVAAPEATDRRPPPDRPGAEGLPSRAESRAGAAAANETTPDQEDASPLDERAGAPADDGARESGPGASDEEPSSPDGADAGQGLGKEADESAGPSAPEAGTVGGQNGPEGQSKDHGSIDLKHSGASAQTETSDIPTIPQDASGPADATGGDEADPSPEPSLETDTVGGAAGADTGAAEANRGEDDGDDFLSVDSVRQEDDQAATVEKGSQSERGKAETPEDNAEGKLADVLGQADDGIGPSAGQRGVGESPTILDRIKASVAGALEDASETTAESAKQAKGAPDAAAFRPAGRGERRVEPLDDRTYAEHTRHVESTVRNALDQGESTDVKHTLNPEHTRWDPDRAELHQQILDDLYSAAADVPNDGHAIIAGGLGGAGKSTTLDDHAGIDRSNYLTINPDDIKESLGRRGMIPAVGGLAPMEGSALVHEESSQIAGALADRAYADRKNVIWDITMSSKGSATKRIQQLRDAGYNEIEGIFVHIPVEKSVDRAEVRHRHGLEDYRNGEGLGGRYVPPDVIRANTDPAWGSVNRGVFEELKPQFDRWRIYDNSVDGRDPVLLESSDSSERNENE